MQTFENSDTCLNMCWLSTAAGSPIGSSKTWLNRCSIEFRTACSFNLISWWFDRSLFAVWRAIKDSSNWFWFCLLSIANVNVFSLMDREAIVAMTVESMPPDSRQLIGTSATRREFTASSMDNLRLEVEATRGFDLVSSTPWRPPHSWFGCRSCQTLVSIHVPACEYP